MKKLLIETFAFLEVMKKRNYKTAVFGIWHYDGLPISGENDILKFNFPLLPLIEGNEKIRESNSHDKGYLLSGSSCWIEKNCCGWLY